MRKLGERSKRALYRESWLQRKMNMTAQEKLGTRLTNFGASRHAHSALYILCWHVSQQYLHEIGSHVKCSLKFWQWSVFTGNVCAAAFNKAGSLTKD